MATHIVFTGGGTAGHVTPNLALIEEAQTNGWQVSYIGSGNSVEQDMISAINIPFYAIKSGKLRRYFSWKNFVDPINILWGIGQSYCLLRKMKPDVVFSKGGFVAFPVVFAAWLRRVPVVAHESDMTPGLANRLSFPFVNKICLTFAAAKAHFKHPERIEITGTPIRRELFQGNKQTGLALCSFDADKPCLLVMGGSQGAAGINQVLRDALPQLEQQFQIIHLCGKGKVDNRLASRASYHQVEYANEELPHLMAAADLVVSRSGANSLYEILALKKAHVLIPLSTKKSRGDQIHNARYFSKLGISTVLDDDTLSVTQLIEAVTHVYHNRADVVRKIDELGISSATDRVLAVIRHSIDSNHCYQA